VTSGSRAYLFHSQPPLRSSFIFVSSNRLSFFLPLLSPLEICPVLQAFPIPIFCTVASKFFLNLLPLNAVPFLVGASRFPSSSYLGSEDINCRHIPCLSLLSSYKLRFSLIFPRPSPFPLFLSDDLLPPANPPVPCGSPLLSLLVGQLFLHS